MKLITWWGIFLFLFIVYVMMVLPYHAQCLSYFDFATCILKL